MTTSRISVATKALKDQHQKHVNKTALGLMRDLRKAGYHYPKSMDKVLRGKA